MLVAFALLFILSGAAGLLYESVWARYLGLFVGHTAYAQVIVLVIFLGGMAIGSWLVGRRSERLRDPLFGYALVEGAIGLLGLLFHPVYVGVTNWAYHSLFAGMAGSPFLTLAKWGLAGLLIMPQSVLLGATFPLMSAGVLRRIGRSPGRTLSLLYFANSFGAAVGVLVAGFFLVPLVGLPGTILAAAVANLLVALATLLIRRHRKVQPAEPGDAPPPSVPAPSVLSAPVIHRLLLGVSFGTALTSFIYEIAWIRMLALVLSSASHAFDLMLSAFILGLALGAFWVRSRADRFRDSLRVLGIVQWVMGFFALATLPLYFWAFDWTVTLFQTFAKTEAGYAAFSIGRYAICLAVMFPATFCAGITLPLITMILVQGSVGEKAIGQVYSANTAGSIVGASLAGLVLMPLLGLKALLAAGALGDMGIGLAILLLLMRATPPSRRLALAAAGCTILVLAAVIFSPAFDRRLLLSGVYRAGRLPDLARREVLYYRDGRTATVAATRRLPQGDIFISTNGKSDGGLAPYWLEPCHAQSPKYPLADDAATLTLAALVTMAHRPDAKTGAVIGQGTGVSSHLLLGSSKLSDLYTIEIEPEMIRASRAFYPANRRVFDDPRSHFVIDDAKSYFAAAGKSYDYIFSEPSQPWVSGVSGLFTAEFYERVRQYLAPDGIFAQWMHVYDTEDRLVMTVLAALHRTFRHYELFMVAQGDILVIATNAAVVPKPDWGIFALPTIASDFCHQIPINAEAMEATRLGNEVSFGSLAGGYPVVNSDFFPALENGAEQARYLGHRAQGFMDLGKHRFDITAPFANRRLGPVSFTLAPIPEIPRMRALALGALLRNLRERGGGGSMVSDEESAVAVEREHAWEAELDAPKPPSFWHLWLQRMSDSERDRYAGTQGTVDEDFFRSIYGYLDRFAAPAEVRAAVDFRHGITGWNFRQAVGAASPLIAATLAGRPWIPADELRDGVVVAQLMTGDVGGARRTFSALAPHSTRPPDDLRTALLESHVEAGEARGNVP